ncbi:ABC transporter permease [Oerskovia flava]|uniref:ABC transporter permease n=1 Tax=Oerskovia flava TaxID=2986422 RepID=UPI002240E0D0|nr:ABC transporter permease [Oerskovia sp. JB1-3-2]
MTTTAPADVARTHRPGPHAWAALVAAESRMVVRDTAGLVVPLGLPLLILVMYGIGQAEDETIAGTGGRTVFDLYVLPLVLTIVIATIGVVNMPSFLSSYRRSGVLRRLSVTPASPAMVLVAQVVVSALQTVVGITLALVVATTAFGAHLPARPWQALGVLVLAAAAMYAVGMVVAAVAPTPNSSLAIGLVLFFAFGATGGMFGGTQNLPAAVQTVGEALPFGAAVQAVGAAWVGRPVEVSHVVALVAAVVVGGLISARNFRWD